MNIYCFDGQKSKERAKEIPYELGVHVDPKVMIGVRYRDLYHLYIQLVTRATENEETYDTAKDSMQKKLETVNIGLKNKQLKIISVDTVGNARSGSTSTIVPSNIGSANETRGIKTKEKLTRRSSKRLQSNLENATKKRKTKGKRSSQSIQDQLRIDTYSSMNSVEQGPSQMLQFLNQVSYQQNHVPVSSGSMTQSNTGNFDTSTVFGKRSVDCR
ncbi:hypothetical protein M9H77_04698 [Catharanthus roseus]|uniref:Uncharacterized protein n=1 Tax=Catharanthus roseus TaxID=4058 RepID=A0ACC0CEZ1_CATRO|nr:hypothetical protein M9H77_04698 [Catharanthus roseus]